MCMRLHKAHDHGTALQAPNLFNGQGLSLAQARESEAGGLANLFMEAVATPA